MAIRCYLYVIDSKSELQTTEHSKIYYTNWKIIEETNSVLIDSDISQVTGYFPIQIALYFNHAMLIYHSYSLTICLYSNLLSWKYILLQTKQILIIFIYKKYSTLMKVLDL